MKKWLVLIGAIICLVVYTAYIEPHLLFTEEKKLDMGLGQEIRLVQFTDTQLGEFFSLDQLEKTVDLINQSKPDIIVFTGDLIDEAYDYPHKEEALEILKKLDAGAVKIAINGNHDLGGGGKKIYGDLMEAADFIVLVNGSLKYKTQSGKQLAFYGVDDAMLGLPDFDFIKNGIDEADANVLLIHEPDDYDHVKAYPIDLALAGHSHGGQISLPFYGPIVTPPNSRIYKRGDYNIDNQRGTLLYVNSGLGNTKMILRFGNPPKITLFKLY